MDIVEVLGNTPFRNQSTTFVLKLKKFDNTLHDKVFTNVFLYSSNMKFLNFVIYYKWKLVSSVILRKTNSNVVWYIRLILYKT